MDPSVTRPAAPTLPDIMDYVDYRLFLKERLERLAAHDKKFSQRWVAKRAGFKAPQLLSMIVQGHRNLTKDKALDLARALKLSERETDYFVMLLDLADCATPEQRHALLEKINATFRDGLFSSIPDDGIEIFRDWYYPAVREIVTLKDAQPTAAWVADRLGISPEDARDALDTLVARDFLRWEGERLVRAEPSVRTNKNKIYPMMLASYHLKVFERAFPAVRLGRDKRHFEGLTFAVPRRKLPEVKEMIQRFFREVDTLVEAQEDGREEVCQLHVAMFPLTRWTDGGS